jgi:hypothetical protein
MKRTKAQLESELQDYKEAHADKQRLVREMDVILNGEEGAAKQASLCDLVGQIKTVAERVSTLKGALSILRQNVLLAIEHANAGVNGAQEPRQALHHVLAALPSVESLVGIIPVCTRCKLAVFENWSKLAGGMLCRSCYEKGEREFQEQSPQAA